MIASVIREYTRYSPEQGVDVLLRMRQRLACSMHDLATEIGALEEQKCTEERELKIGMAVKEIDGVGNVAEKKNQAIVSTRKEALQLASVEGKLKAYRIEFESAKEVLNSMSSYLAKM